MRIRYMLLLLACFLPPVRAQDDEHEHDHDDEWEDKSKKFGEETPRDDIDAPKVATVTQEKINKAIAAGVKWLKTRQD